MGIQTAKERNLTLAAKMCWRMETFGNVGWAEALKKKYRLRAHCRKGNHSCVWTAINKGKPICDKGSKWLIGNNSMLSFWHDKWINEGTIRILVKGPLNRGEEEIIVTDLMQNGTWAIENFSLKLPPDVQRAIRATPICRSTSREDQRCWIASANGEFETKIAYLFAINEELSIQEFTGTWLWKLCTLPKIKFFLWKCYHNSLPVNAILERRGIEGLGGCRSCLDPNETIFYVLRDCPEAQCFWRQAKCPLPLWSSFSGEFLDWIHENSNSKLLACDKDYPWCVFFLLGIWNLWLQRNRKIFRQ